MIRYEKDVSEALKMYCCRCKLRQTINHTHTPAINHLNVESHYEHFGTTQLLFGLELNARIYFTAQYME